MADRERVYLQDYGEAVYAFARPDGDPTKDSLASATHIARSGPARWRVVCDDTSQQVSRKDGAKTLLRDLAGAKLARLRTAEGSGS